MGREGEEGGGKGREGWVKRGEGWGNLQINFQKIGGRSLDGIDGSQDLCQHSVFFWVESLLEEEKERGKKGLEKQKKKKEKKKKKRQLSFTLLPPFPPTLSPSLSPPLLTLANKAIVKASTEANSSSFLLGIVKK